MEYYILSNVNSSNEYGDSSYEPSFVSIHVNEKLREIVRNVIALWSVLQEATKGSMVHVTVRREASWYMDMTKHAMNAEDTLNVLSDGLALPMRDPIPDRFDDEESWSIRGDWMDIYYNGDEKGDVTFRSYEKHCDTDYSSERIPLAMILQDPKPEEFMEIEWKPEEASGGGVEDGAIR